MQGFVLRSVGNIKEKGVKCPVPKIFYNLMEPENIEVVVAAEKGNLNFDRSCSNQTTEVKSGEYARKIALKNLLAPCCVLQTEIGGL